MTQKADGRWTQRRTDAGVAAQKERSRQYQAALRRLREKHAPEFERLLTEERGRGDATGTD